MARARTVYGLKPKGTVRANARKIVAVRTDEFFAFAPFLADPTNVTELHDMRIAAKRLRYALELFADALGPETAACIERIKEFQEVVGDIHDHDVHADILRAHLETLAAARAHALADRAMRTETEIAPFKEECRAFVTDDGWVAEQTAIAAAIARTMRERRQRHTDLIAAWTEWNAAGLRAQLDALSSGPLPKTEAPVG
ncbi:MAG: CHAD domain-containing protein [Thermomicrobiales bacterium]